VPNNNPELKNENLCILYRVSGFKEGDNAALLISREN